MSQRIDHSLVLVVIYDDRDGDAFDEAAARICVCVTGRTEAPSARAALIDPRDGEIGEGAVFLDTNPATRAGVIVARVGLMLVVAAVVPVDSAEVDQTRGELLALPLPKPFHRRDVLLTREHVAWDGGPLRLSQTMERYPLWVLDAERDDPRLVDLLFAQGWSWLFVACQGAIRQLESELRRFAEPSWMMSTGREASARRLLLARWESLTLYRRLRHALLDADDLEVETDAASKQEAELKALDDRLAGVLGLPGVARSAMRHPSGDGGGAEQAVDRRYDVAVAYTASGAIAAADLKRALGPHRRVFVSDRSLDFGDRWDEVIPEAFAQTRIIAVIVTAEWRESRLSGSMPWHGPWYLQALLARHIPRAAEGVVRIVPILYGRAERTDLPFGLASFVPAVVSGGWDGVADRLGVLLDRGSGAPTAIVCD